METLRVKTDLHCADCVKKISPIMNSEERINDWSVDLDNPKTILTVQGENLTSEHVDNLLKQAGYSVQLDENIGHQNISGFWSNKNLWMRASFNTLNCLIGCSIGDFGMIIFLQAYYPNTSMLVQMILAVIAGLITSIMLETSILKFREHFNWQLALKTAFGMSFISMVGMEIAMNTTDFIITGGKAAFEDPMYWFALVVALIAGFIAPLPYNYYKLKKFKQACH